MLFIFILKPKFYGYFFILFYVLFTLFSLLFISDEMWGLGGFIFSNLIVLFICSFGYYANKYENVKVSDGNISLCSKDTIMDSIPISEIVSFNVELVSSHNGDSVNLKNRKVYQVIGSDGTRFEFSYRLYNFELVYEVLNYCLSLNPKIESNFKKIELDKNLIF